jgi:anti-sigma factor RsiW
MTHHLSPQDFIDALDGRLDAARARHLDGCDACGAELVHLRAVVDDVTSATVVPEPSPLFWNHFSQRVREATDAQPLPGGRFAWTAGWQSLVALTAAVAVVVAVGLRNRQPATTPTSEPASSAAATLAAPSIPGEDGSWDFMVLLAADLPADELQQIAAPVPGAADTLASHLTLEQRTELVRLLKAEMGRTE